ncbi:hypothetical protein ACFO25_00525 [Paenactinomyces guangxiensis]|uniref:Uncharacterized protein n=1 Tax=Paenactinomyces guangxiensis TaxID=1490290 RepID=A0A7W2A9H6_9BACL|nr:hypothetical protein [Paenactinomyces guangxiensis]MBA4495197.1 hypothetical protein [Paenactinomyces guangxiensis]MBH8592281.1 hypothetical protein [Paenactinomyces guangxiensis]
MKSFFKKITAGLASAFLLFGVMGIQTAFAASYYCDNDRDPNMYSCTNSLSGSWAYRSGQSGDQHGDDRLHSTTNVDNYYRWNFNRSGTFNGYAYLNNWDFTNPAADYYVGNSGKRSVNQNTAPAGWSYVGTGSGADVWVFTNWRTKTGADMVRVDTSSLSQSENHSGSKPTVDLAYHQDPKVAAIQKKMLNAVDYYKDIQGSFHIAFTNNQQNEQVEFMIAEGTSPGSSIKVTGKNGTVREMKSDGKSLLELNHQTRAYQKSKAAYADPDIANGPRYYKDEAGRSVYVTRQDPAQAHAANEVTLPQHYAFWLSNPNNKVTGHEKLLNRDVTVVEGTHDAYLAKKLKAKSYKMWVDTNTGVLLKLEGKDANGKEAYHIMTTQIRINQGVDQSKFSTSDHLLKGWKNLSLNRQ